jgi:hypothetical protein
MRIAALGGIPVVYVMTHDSIGLGEDGPNHQPVETLASLRAIPNLLVIRPGDGNETSGASQVAVTNRKRPTVLHKLRTLGGSLKALARSNASPEPVGLLAVEWPKPDDIVLDAVYEKVRPGTLALLHTRARPRAHSCKQTRSVADLL